MKTIKPNFLSRKTLSLLCFMSASLTMTAFAGSAKALETLTLDSGYALGPDPSLPAIHGQPRSTIHRGDVYNSNQQLEVVPKDRGTVMIKHRSTNKCLNAYRPGIETLLNFWPCSDSDGDQRFHLEMDNQGRGIIRREGTNLCVDAPHRSTGQSLLQLHVCNSNNANHLWKRNPIFNGPATNLPSTVMLTSWANNLALDSGGANNTDIYGHPNPTTANPWHQWELHRAGNYYLLKNKATGKALDAGGDGGRTVYPHPQPNIHNDFHLWRIESVGSNRYMIISKATGRALDSGGSNNDIYAHPTPMGHNPYHQWKMTSLGGSTTTQGQAFNQREYLNQLYINGQGAWSRGPHNHTNAIDTYATGSTQVKALVGGEVLSVRQGTQLSRVSHTSNSGYHPSRGWVKASDYNAEVIIYNPDLNRTFTYLHFSSINVRPGQRVNSGDVIGIEGATGWSDGRHTHLHVQVGRGTSGSRENPLVTLGNARARNIIR